MSISLVGDYLEHSGKLDAWSGRGEPVERAGFDAIFAIFFSPIPDERLSLRLQIAQSGTVMWQSPTMAVEKNVGYFAFEPIQLPLGALPLQAYAYPHQLILQARHGNSGGEHLLEVDDLLLLPHEPYFV